MSEATQDVTALLRENLRNTLTGRACHTPYERSLDDYSTLPAVTGMVTGVDAARDRCSLAAAV